MARPTGMSAIARTKPSPAHSGSPHRSFGILILFALPLLLGGCNSVAPHQQLRLASLQNQFQDGPVYAFQSGVLPGIEPGTAESGGATPSGCSACR